jgi:4-hydroxy-tetrahydrodipicolinate synthase
MMKAYPGGVWPVMLTPFTEKGELDVDGLCALTEWYIENGVKGLFAACQSSEIAFLTLDERVRITETVIRAARGRVPVIASGHVSDNMENQVKELSAMAGTGADAVIMITNHLCRQGESDDIWLSGMETLLSRLDPKVNLGVYECPAPYKRLLTERTLRFLADSGRFYFLKDTCCDAEMIKSRIRVIEGSNLGLYNANSATLLETLRAGARGFSGVMANMHPELYVWLTSHIDHKNAEIVQSAICTGSLIERQCYPVCAKYHLSNIEGLPITTFCRTRDDRGLNATLKKEVHSLDALMNDIYDRYCVD